VTLQLSAADFWILFLMLSAAGFMVLFVHLISFTSLTLTRIFELTTYMWELMNH
jgi:hypothetical protein